MRLLRRDPVIQSLWQHYLINEVVPSGISRDTWKRQIATAHLWLANMPDETEVSMMCEVQMVLKKYSTTRTAMHELYKIVRAPNAQALCNEFAKYGHAFAVQEKNERDGSTEFGKACRDGDSLLVAQFRPHVPLRVIEAGLLIACEHVRIKCVQILLEAAPVEAPAEDPTVRCVTATIQTDHT